MKKPMSKLLLATMVAGNLMQGGILLAQEAKPAAAGQVAAVLDTKLIQDPAARQAVEAIQKKVAVIKGYEAELGRMMLDPNGGFAEFTDELTVRLPDRMLLKRTFLKTTDLAQIGSKATMTVDGTWLFIQNVPPPPSPERLKNYQEMLKQASSGGKPYTQAEIDKLVAERVRYLMRPAFTKINLKTVEQAVGSSVGEYIATQGDPANPFAPYKLETLKLASETPGEWVLLADWREKGDSWSPHRLTIDKQTGLLKEMAAKPPGTDQFIALLTVKKLSPKANLADALFQVQIPDKNSPDFTHVDDNTDMSINDFKEQRKREANKNGPAVGKEEEKTEAAVAPKPDPAASEKKKVNEAFFQLCKTGTIEQVKAAIAAGADVNARNERQRTPLMVAASEHPNPDIIVVLVKAGAEINAEDRHGGIMPLACAAWNKNAEMVPALLKAGAKVDARNGSGWTPLMIAVMMQGSNPEAIAALIKAGSDVNAKSDSGYMPLLIAAGRGSPEVVAALIKAGAKVNVKDGYGETPLMAAVVSNENPEVVAVLLKAGAEVNVRTQGGMTPLLVAAIGNKLAVIAALLKAGAEVNVMDEMDMTPLMRAAAAKQDPEVIRALIKAGANVNAKNKHGKSVLMLAKENQNQQVAEELIKAGAK